MSKERKLQKPLSRLEEVCLDAYILDSGNIDEAYLLCHPKTKTQIPLSAHRMALRWIKEERAAAYIAYRKALFFPDKEKTAEDLEKDVVQKYKSKEYILTRLAAILEDEETGNKEQLAAIKELINLFQMKGEEKEKQEVIHRYVPLTCDACPHMERYVEEQRIKREAGYDD